MNARKTASLVVVIALFGGCASNPAPKDWLPTPADAQTTAYGGWIRVWTSEGALLPAYQGELLAVETGTIRVLARQGELWTIGEDQVVKAEMIPHNPELDQITKWTLLGAILTVPIFPALIGSESSLGSHGVFFVFSAPIWLAMGAFSSHVHYRSVCIQVSQADLQTLRAYARFPQGVPEGVDSQLLRPKPY
ncbi:MAG: hypothetical protein JSW54_03685, partial [Fidelibacterota bacterium]